MPLLKSLKRSFALPNRSKVLVRDEDEHTEANIARLPTELLEIITLLLDSRSLCNLRLCSKRIALLTTNLLIPFCAPNRTCVNATNSLDILIEGSRLPILNGTITNLTLSAPSWKSPLARYGAGLRHVRLLRLTYLKLYKISIIQASDLHHFLSAHSRTLKHLHGSNVHLPDLESWQRLFGCLAQMRRLKTLELKYLFYSVTRTLGPTRFFILPRSSYDASSNDVTVMLNAGFDDGTDDCTTARNPHDIDHLLANFYTENGHLKKDFGHKQLLAHEQKGWIHSMKRRIAIPLRIAT